jgi:hypothetical protein
LTEALLAAELARESHPGDTSEDSCVVGGSRQQLVDPSYGLCASIWVRQGLRSMTDLYGGFIDETYADRQRVVAPESQYESLVSLAYGRDLRRKVFGSLGNLGRRHPSLRIFLVHGTEKISSHTTYQREMRGDIIEGAPHLIQIPHFSVVLELRGVLLLLSSQRDLQSPLCRPRRQNSGANCSPSDYYLSAWKFPGLCN